MIDMAKFVLVALLVTIVAHQRVLGEFDGRWNDQLCLVLTIGRGRDPIYK